MILWRITSTTRGIRICSPPLLLFVVQGKYYVAESIFRRLLNELQEKDSDLQLVSRAMNDLGISLQAQVKLYLSFSVAQVPRPL